MSIVTTDKPGFARSVWLVTEREVASKLRSKAFVVSTLLLFAAALAGVIWGGFAAQSPSETPVAVTAETRAVLDGVPGVAATVADTPDAARSLVKAGTVDAALVPSSGDGSFGFTLVAKDSVPRGLVALLSVSPPVELLDTGGVDPVLRSFIAIGFGVVFLLGAATFGSTIASSVTEEKQTRVVELLISAVPVRALLAGKVVGNTILAMAQILVLAAIAIVGLSVTGQSGVLSALGAPILWFAVFFLFGFVLLAALFAAAGAMVSRQEDLGSTMTPLTMLVMAPYVLVIVFNDNPAVMAVLSYVPFSAPVGMPMRLYLGDAQWWEPLLSLVILLITCGLAILAGARIYRTALLRMGARVTLAEALRGRG